MLILTINLIQIKSQCIEFGDLVVCNNTPKLNQQFVCNYKYDLINLKDNFIKMSQQLPEDGKHFYGFILYNSQISELEENVFSGISFEMILIFNSTNLNAININAFNGTESTIEYFYSTNTPLINKDMNTTDIFGVFSKLYNLKSLEILNSNIQEIPSYAFKPVNGYQFKIQYITIDQSIKRVMNNAFYNLDSLKGLYISNNSIDILQSDALKFRKTNNRDIFYILLDCKAFNTSTSIEQNAFKNLNIPSRISNIEDCNLTHLEEKNFAPFLDKEFNTFEFGIYGADTEIDCNNCKSYWIIKNDNYRNKIYNLKCSDGKDFNDITNYSHCNENVINDRNE